METQNRPFQDVKAWHKNLQRQEKKILIVAYLLLFTVFMIGYYNAKQSQVEIPIVKTQINSYE